MHGITQTMSNTGKGVMTYLNLQVNIEDLLFRRKGFVFQSLQLRVNFLSTSLALNLYALFGEPLNVWLH